MKKHHLLRLSIALLSIFPVLGCSPDEAYEKSRRTTTAIVGDDAKPFRIFDSTIDHNMGIQFYVFPSYCFFRKFEARADVSKPDDVERIFAEIGKEEGGAQVFIVKAGTKIRVTQKLVWEQAIVGRKDLYNVVLLDGNDAGKSGWVHGWSISRTHDFYNSTGSPAPTGCNY